MGKKWKQRIMDKISIKKIKKYQNMILFYLFDPYLIKSNNAYIFSNL